MVALDIPKNLSQIFPKRNQKIELRNFITLNSLNLTVPTVFNCRGNEVAPSQEMNHLSNMPLIFRAKTFVLRWGGWATPTSNHPSKTHGRRSQHRSFRSYRSRQPGVGLGQPWHRGGIQGGLTGNIPMM